MNTDVERQVALEAECLELGAERHRYKIEGKPTLHTPGGAVTVDVVAEAFEVKLAEIRSWAIETRPYSWAVLLEQASPTYWVTWTLQAVLGNPELPLGLPWTSTGFDIVARAREEMRYSTWLETQSGKAMSTYIKRTQHRSSTARGRRIANALRRQERVSLANKHFTGQLGSNLLFHLVEQGGGAFLCQVRREGRQQKRYLVASPELIELVRASNDAGQYLRPTRLAMVAPPRPWTWSTDSE